MATTKKALNEAYIGATETGKTKQVKKRLAKLKPSRCLVWDWKREWNAPVKVSTVGELLEELKKVGTRSRFYIAFHPSYDDQVRKKQFDTVCRLVRACGNLLFLVEELQYMTKPTYTPPAWLVLVTSGREWGVKLIGTSQRPAKIDKDFLGNATALHVRRLGYKADRVTMAEEMDISPDELHGMTGFDYIEKDRKTGKITRSITKK